MERLSKRSTNWLLRQGAITQEDQDVFEYGFDIAYSTAINVVFMLILSLFMGRLPQTLVYHLAFVPLRQSAGGFHASTRLRCFIISAVLWLASLWIIDRIAALPWIGVGLAALSCIAVCALAPVDHENAPMGMEKRQRMKRISRGLSLAFAGIVGVLCLMVGSKPGWIGASISVGMACAAGTLCVAMARRRWGKKQE